MKKQKFKLPKEPKFYLKYSGLGLIAVSLIFYNMNNAKFVVGFGLFLFAISLMIKKK